MLQLIIYLTALSIGTYMQNLIQNSLHIIIIPINIKQHVKAATCTPSCRCRCSAACHPCCTSPARWHHQSPFCSPGCCGPSLRSNRSPRFQHPSNVRQMLRKKKGLKETDTNDHWTVASCIKRDAN